MEGTRHLQGTESLAVGGGGAEQMLSRARTEGGTGEGRKGCSKQASTEGLGRALPGPESYHLDIS